MSTPDYTSLVHSQRTYFKTGKTRAASWRVAQLKAIKAMIEASRGAIREALWHDLRRNETDADLMDIDINIHEAELALAHLHDWMKPRREATPIVLEPGHVRVRRDPLGVTLIIGAWNEPFMLTLGPLVSAIAAGNTAVVKPSEVSEASAAVVAEMIPKFLDPAAVAVHLDDRALGQVGGGTGVADHGGDLALPGQDGQVGQDRAGLGHDPVQA